VAASVATVAVSVLGLWGQRKLALRRERSLFDRSDRVIVLVVLFPFALFTEAVLATAMMNLAVLLQRVWEARTRKRYVQP